MAVYGPVRSSHGLDNHGLTNLHNEYWNLRIPAAYEHAIAGQEGELSVGGALVVNTGAYTGRVPQDKFVVDEPGSRDSVWWGEVNRPFPEPAFETVHTRLSAFFQNKTVFVRDMHLGAHPQHRLRVRVVTRYAWHSLFAANMFVAPEPDERTAFVPDLVILHAPDFQASPEIDGTHSECFVLVHLSRRLVLIGGTHYAGEIKKAAFTVMNYVAPEQGLLPMHCSANTGADGQTAVFFGLSGTGKTTLSADPERYLVGDDEHGWAADGIFNFEGGCYAKVIRLDPNAEPDIFNATGKFGTILENVVMDQRTHRVDFSADLFTENTRASYPLSFIPNASDTGRAAAPSHIIMLTCDAFGVLPPVARLTPAQAMYHFLQGYTAKVAGTEAGLTEPKAAFSACFAAPFLPRPPELYARMLGDRLDRGDVQCWLVNTGWTGGPYGRGTRIPIGQTRAMLRAILQDTLADTPMSQDSAFGLTIPTAVPGVAPAMLNPRAAWPDPAAFDRQARDVAARFASNFDTYFAGVQDTAIRAAAITPETVGAPP